MDASPKSDHQHERQRGGRQALRLPGIAGRTALVTGGARGIGAAIAAELAAQDAAVVALDLHVPDATLDATSGAAPGAGSVTYLSCDVADPASLDAALGEVARARGPAAILVNNAGVLRQAAFEDITAQDWELTLRVNVTATLLCSQRVLPAMRAAGYGRIVCVGSSAGKQGGGPGLAAYAASKAAVLSLTKSMAKEYSGLGITVNAVAPAAIATEMIRDLAGFAGGASLPVGRLGQPEEVATAVAFLCSSAASFITGEIFDVNGGLIID